MNRFLNKTVALIFLYSLFFAFLSFFYLQKISAFGCFDDCNNFIGGYFLLKDKQIFSEFFFNHAPGMAYLSFLVQKIAGPDQLYHLILTHRIFLFGFSFLCGILLIYRFKIAAFIFLLIFESSKYYIFGDRFLAENFIAYPVIYIFGLILYKTENLEIKIFDYYIAGIFTWFIIFMREPYTPLAIVMFALLIVGKLTKPKIISVLFFLIPSTLSLMMLPIKEMYENIFLYNRVITNSEVAEKGGGMKIMITALLYPIYIFITGNQTLFKIIEQIISFVFLISITVSVLEKKYKLVLVIVIILGLSNIRYVIPGEMFYGSFHMVIWFALLVFATIYLSSRIKLNPRYKYFPYTILLTVIVFSLFSKESFTNRNINKSEEFFLSYNNYYAYGTAIKALSDPSDSLFLEERDDIIYWTANIKPAYKYSWYTSLMPLVDKYKEERLSMFKNNPPDFYYDACLLLKRKQKDPKGYGRVLIYNKPSCLLIKNAKIKEIEKAKWDSVSGLGFAPPQT